MAGYSDVTQRAELWVLAKSFANWPCQDLKHYEILHADELRLVRNSRLYCQTLGDCTETWRQEG
jgi:hypothetical protein